jgi:hypothetical protein
LIIHQYTVYAYDGWDKDDFDEDVEVSWHYTLEKAISVADAHYKTTGEPCRVDLNAVEILRYSTGHSRECVWADSDLYFTEPNPRPDGTQWSRSDHMYV